MIRTFIIAVILAGAILPQAALCQTLKVSTTKPDDGFEVAPDDWPWWRGPLRMGEANPNQTPPTKWSATENVIWASPVPGRGHGSPIVVGKSIYLATWDENTGSQSVLCYDRATGRRVWTTEVHASGGMKKNKKATAASSTLACDGERLFINFPNSGAIYTTALTLDGKRIWQTRVADYVVHQGYGSSPAVYQSLVIVTADNKGGGTIAALDRKSGDIVWKVSRPKLPNYPSPIILHIARRDQLIMTGCKLISSFDPLTGKKLWEVDGATEECVTSTVTDGKHVYSSGGYPRNHMSAVVADGSETITWANGDRVYVPSFVVRDGYLFGVMDAGVAGCWNAATGKEMWKKRLRGNFTSSPVLVGENIYATNESGETFIFRADPEKYVAVARNKLGDESYATPTICGSRIYMRLVNRTKDGAKETLYCLGNKTPTEK